MMEEGELSKTQQIQRLQMKIDRLTEQRIILFDELKKAKQELEQLQNNSILLT